MGLFKRKKHKEKSDVGVYIPSKHNPAFLPRYKRLDQCAEIMTGCRRIAELIGSLTIHLMENTDSGDTRIVNELSRKLDIEPNDYMTRKTWIESIVMNLLLYGNGNSIVTVTTTTGAKGDVLLDQLTPIEAYRVTLDDVNRRVMIDGIPYDDDQILHFILNPDPMNLWRGQGIRISLKELAEAIQQANKTKNDFLSTEYMPSLIVKVDALTEEFASMEGRKKLIESYAESGKRGDPWIIPAEQFQVEQVKPLTLADLAIKDTVELDKRAVAAVLGVPPFLLGVGDYKKEEWNAFVNNTVKPIVIGLQQEMTRKLILSPYWYIKFNVLSLLDWDIKTVSDVFGSLSDRGFVTGNEVRDRIGMSPKEGLDELRILENYIPYNLSGAQKKLIQQGGEDIGNDA